MNVRRLRAIQRLIRNHPTAVDMFQWVTAPQEMRDASLHRARNPECGTVACIAGWTAVRFGQRELTNARVKLRDLLVGEEVFYSLREAPMQHPIPRLAARLLDLTRDQATRLFMPACWPEPWSTQIATARSGSDEAAALVSRYIDHFIDTERDQ